MSDEPITFEETLLIGENDRGYRFGVGRVGDRWIGFALGRTITGGMLFLLPEIAVDHQLGLTLRDEAIRQVAAIAQDPEHAFGGVDRWYVAPELRASPDDYRCEHCGEILCGGRCEGEDYEEV
jgi:hypothetical protein